MKSLTLNKTPLIISGTMLGVTLGLGTMLTSNIVSADDDASVVDQINITIPVSCTLEATGQNTHNAEINNGQYNSSIGETTMKTFCNDNNGFAIYAIGYTNNEEGNNVLTNSTLDSTYDIVTGTATSGNTSNWAMKLSTVSDPTPTYPLTIENSFDSFHNVPDDYTLVAKRLSVTDTGTNAEGSTLKSTYQVYINQTQPAGTYTGQVKYTLVHPNDAVAPVKPIACNPNGTTIGTNTSTDIICMQDISSTNKSSIMGSMTEGTPYLLYDSRDEQQYNIAKLADDNIWMLDNLAIDPTDLTTAAKMNASNTNASAAAITNFLNGGSTTTGWSNVAVADVDSAFDSYTEPRINNSSKDTLVTSYGPAAVSGQAKVGIYYNFCAASVGTYCFDENSGVDLPDTLVDAPEDICPANWRMPTGGTSDEYHTLCQEYGNCGSSNTYLQDHLSISLSGYYSGNSPLSQNSYSFLWSSTNYNTASMSTTYIYSNMSLTYYPGIRNTGGTIRCLAGE